MATGYNVRVGDADREAVAAQLREHYAVGRLTLEELNERLDQAFTATTKADLNAVMRDLPHAVSGGGGQGALGPGGPRRPYGAFAPVLGLVWLFIILGSVFLFNGIGGGRPLAIILFLAALALVRRLFGLGRRRSCGGPRGPRGRRRW